MVIDGLGLNADAVRDYIAGQKPTYPQFEAWIQTQEGAKLDADSVGALNASIEGYNHDDETRQGILSANGLPDGDPKDAINLNNLDDWLEFHAAEIALIVGNPFKTAAYGSRFFYVVPSFLGPYFFGVPSESTLGLSLNSQNFMKTLKSALTTTAFAAVAVSTVQAEAFPPPCPLAKV